MYYSISLFPHRHYSSLCCRVEYQPCIHCTTVLLIPVEGKSLTNRWAWQEGRGFITRPRVDCLCLMYSTYLSNHHGNRLAGNLVARRYLSYPLRWGCVGDGGVGSKCIHLLSFFTVLEKPCKSADIVDRIVMSYKCMYWYRFLRLYFCKAIKTCKIA